MGSPQGSGSHGGIGIGSVRGNVTVQLAAARAGVRSAYRQQVQRIAPTELLGRQAELGELAGFCTEPARGPYVWWRAPAWAGKSALMSTFVLHPPPGVVVISFFITARLAAQDTREAFTQVVLEQAAALLGQDLPPSSPATVEAHLLALLEETAAACAQAGQRLILVVDGLDEDRGVTAGPDAHSIAAFLPARPPAGMRIVVAGRPNPPIPDDVPAGHPLRDPGIVRLLAASDYAQDVRTAGPDRTEAAAARHPRATGPARPADRGPRWPVRPGPGRPDRACPVGDRGRPAHRVRADLHPSRQSMGSAGRTRGVPAGA